MALTTQDLDAVRNLLLDALDVVVMPRFDNLENHFDNLEGRFNGLENRFEGLENRMKRQEFAQQETNRRLSAVETKRADVDGKVTALHNDVIELYGMVH